eukprot:s714_g3.t2
MRRMCLLNALVATWLQFVASAPLKLTNCQWIETGEDLSIDNDTNPAAFASDGNKSSVAIYRSTRQHGTLSLQCEFAEGTARVERIAWSTGLAADCTNESGTLPETKVDSVFLTRKEGEKEWSADEAKSPAKVESKKLFAYVVLKTPQQKACGENHVARVDELSVFGETVHACNGQLSVQGATCAGASSVVHAVDVFDCGFDRQEDELCRTPLVAKIFRIDQDTSIQHVELAIQEAKLLLAAQGHPSIMRSFGLFRAKSGAAFAAGSVLRGLAHLHHRNIVHRDVKDSNIMVTDGGRRVVLCVWPGDVRKEASALTSQVLACQRGSCSSDMFSFGVLLYLLVTGSHPFLEASYEETWDATLRRQIPTEPAGVLANTSQAFVCLLEDADDRRRCPAASLGVLGGVRLSRRTGRENGEDKQDTSHVKFQCGQQDADSCDQKYTRTTNSKYIQCGVSDSNCLSIGPLCTPE